MQQCCKTGDKNHKKWLFEMKTEISKLIDGAFSFLCGGARAQSKFSTENSPFFILKLRQNHFSLKNRNFLTRIVIFCWYEIIPLTAIHWTALKFSKISQKFCLGSLKFLGFSSSLIFGPLEKYKVGEAYRWDCLLPFYVFLSPALSQGQNLTVPPPEKSTQVH